MSSILGYHSMLAAVFCFRLPTFSADPVLRDLIHSFNSLVLQCLNSSQFEPLHLCSLWNLTKKVLFLVALATAKRVGELQRSPVRCRLLVGTPVSRMFRSLSPILSPFPIPFLALSWRSLCWNLLWGWRMSYCFALSVPSAFIVTVLPLLLLFLVVIFFSLSALSFAI